MPPMSKDIMNYQNQVRLPESEDCTSLYVDMMAFVKQY